MTPSAIIERAADDGVIITLTPAGTVKTTGDSAAVNRWLPTLREHKEAIVAALTKASNDPPAASPADTFPVWLIHTPDRRPFEVHLSPPATLAEVLAIYSAATDVQPVRLQEPARSCRTCRHLKRPGLSDGHCSGRDDLRPAYSDGHPLRRLPDDRGARCTTWDAPCKVPILRIVGKLAGEG